MALNWKFDISTFKLLGRELITDRITAIIELVKNCYDANAENVTLTFSNTLDKGSASITISDDGFGMSEYDIKNKWMVIGTNSKRKEKLTPEPFNRRVVGEKGVGRFAIEKIAALCIIETKKQNDVFENKLTINWDLYETPSSGIPEDQALRQFTDIANPFEKKESNNNYHYTKITLSNIREEWSISDIDRVYKELSKLVSPFTTLRPPFVITIFAAFESNKIKNPYANGRTVINQAPNKYATKEITLKATSKYQEVAKHIDGKLIIKKESVKSFGPISLQLFYFDLSAKRQFGRFYQGGDIKIDGIKIYRDGILTTPFAEHKDKISEQRDILGIDKRRWSGFFDKISSRDIIGIVGIGKDSSPRIIDSTNRQDFLDNEEYRALKEFIIQQIIALENTLKFEKDKNKKLVDNHLIKAKDDSRNFTSIIQNLDKALQAGDLNKANINLDILSKRSKALEISVQKGISQQASERRDNERKENMFLSLMSIQTFALEITHIIKTSLSAIKRKVEYNSKHQNNPKRSHKIEEYNIELLKEINKLSEAINFMSDYTRSGEEWEDFNVTDTILRVFSNYNFILDKQDIELITDIAPEKLIIHYNEELFTIILNILIDNSKKALTNISNKKIKLQAYSDENNLILQLSDNGCGIPKENRDQIFNIYYTTTADDSGNGLGLYIARTQLTAINGEIELSDNSEFGEGATFIIKIPFKKEEK